MAQISSLKDRKVPKQNYLCGLCGFTIFSPHLLRARDVAAGFFFFAATAVGLIEIEIKVHHLLVRDRAGARVAEVEFLKQFDRRLALHEGVEGDLQMSALLAKLQRRFHERTADAPPPQVLALTGPRSSRFPSRTLWAIGTNPRPRHQIKAAAYLKLQTPSA